MPRVLTCILIVFLGGCTPTTKEHPDPLKNTKKLVVEGHRDLYNNGAFEVPHTSIKLIPPGPSALDLAGELVGVRAKQSFLMSIKRASESVVVVADGMQLSYDYTKTIHDESNALATTIRVIHRVARHAA